MNRYKHYSFDLWLTLIRSNPFFKKERALFFYRNYNYSNKSIEDVEQAFRNVDSMCNAINEATGKNIDSDEMYLMVISALNDYSADLSTIDSAALYKETESILFNYLPVIYSPQTVEVLHKLTAKTGSTCNILSNTAFIKGSTLKTVLHHLNLSSFFNFQIYSDEVGISKPARSIFELMITRGKAIADNDELETDGIIHIGDSIKADIEGARNAGLHALQINSNQNTILNLLN